MGHLYKKQGDMEKCVYYWKWLATCATEDGQTSELPADLYETIAEWFLQKFFHEKDFELQNEYRQSAEEFCRKMIENPQTERRGVALLSTLGEGKFLFSLLSIVSFCFFSPKKRYFGTL
jgi:hypothetical protein